MILVFESLLPIFLLIALGFGLRRSGIAPEEMWRGIELVAYWVFFPALLAKTMIEADLRSMELSRLAFVMLATFACMSLIVWTVRRPLASMIGLTGPSFTSLFQASTRWNGFIALPILAKLYGDPGVTLVAVVMACLVPAANITNVFVLAMYARGTRPRAVDVVRLAVRNPFIWATAAGLVINLLAISIYEPLMTTLSLLGGAAIASGLLMVGCGLQLGEALTPSPAVIIGTVAKLLLTPAIVVFWSVVTGLSGMAFVVAIVCAAVPTAMNGYVLARQMGGDAPMLATTTTLQTFLSAITVPAVIWLAQLWRG